MKFSFSLFFAFICYVFANTFQAGEEEFCDFECFVSGLKITADLGGAAAFMSYNIPNISIYDLQVSSIAGSVDNPENPQVFTAQIGLASGTVKGPFVKPEEGNETIGDMYIKVQDATVSFSLGFDNYDYAGYKLIAGTRPEMAIDLNLKAKNIQLPCTSGNMHDNCSFGDKLLFGGADFIATIFMPIIKSVLQNQVDKLNDMIKTELDLVFENINTNYTEKYINQSHPLDIPIVPGLMNLTESSLFDMIAWATTDLLNGNTTLALNSLIDRFTKGTGEFVVGTREDTFEELSDMILNALTFNNNSIPSVNGTIDFALTYLQLTGLNTWHDLQFFDPVRYSNQYGTNIPYCDIDDKCDYQVKIGSGLKHLGIKLKFSINATADSETITTSGKKIHEEATFEVVTDNNYMEGRLQLGLYADEFEHYSQNMLKNMTCWGALLNHNCTGIPSLMFNTTISKIDLTAASAYLEDGIQDIINSIADVFIFNYAPVIPAFLNGLFNTLATTNLNDAIQAGIDQECEEDPDPLVLEYKPVAVATTMSLVVIFGVLFSIFAGFFMVIKYRNNKEGKKREYEWSDETHEFSFESNSSDETMKTIQDESITNSISDDEVYNQVDEMTEEEKKKRDEERAAKKKAKQAEKKRTKKRNFLKKMFCSPRWFFAQFTRTDPVGASMFLDERIPFLVRIIIPIICFVNMALFVISNSGTGAVVNAYILFGENNTIQLPVSDFGLIDSVTDMWDAGVYPLAILIMVFSGIWPYVKLFMLLIAWLSPAKIVSVKTRGKLLHFLDYFGKWSFLDSYVMTLMIVAFYFNVPLPIAHPEAVDAPFGVKLYVDAALGFILLMTATMISLLLSHVAVWIHNGLIGDKSDNYGREATKWKPLFMYCKTIFMKIFVTIAIIVSFILVIVGLFIQSFAFDFYGLAGWALGILGESTHRQFSLMDLGIDLPSASRIPDGFNTYFIQTIYFVTVVVFPILHHIFLLIYWLVPLNRKIQNIIHSICDIMYAWACMDVFIISVIAAVLELSQFAASMVAPMCGAPIAGLGNQTLDDIIALFFGNENLIDGHETCFEVAAALEGGCWCLFASVVIYSFVALGISRFGEKALKKRCPKDDEKQEFYQNEALKTADVKPLLVDDN